MFPIIFAAAASAAAFMAATDSATNALASGAENYLLKEDINRSTRSVEKCRLKVAKLLANPEFHRQVELSSLLRNKAEAMKLGIRPSGLVFDLFRDVDESGDLVRYAPLGKEHKIVTLSEKSFIEAALPAETHEGRA